MFDDFDDFDNLDDFDDFDRFDDYRDDTDLYHGASAYGSWDDNHDDYSESYHECDCDETAHTLWNHSQHINPDSDRTDENASGHTFSWLLPYVFLFGLGDNDNPSSARYRTSRAKRRAARNIAIGVAIITALVLFL